MEVNGPSRGRYVKMVCGREIVRDLCACSEQTLRTVRLDRARRVGPVICKAPVALSGNDEQTT